MLTGDGRRREPSTIAGRRVGNLGLGCWAIGGVLHDGPAALGWGPIDDVESSEAIAVAVERGINFFDTADVYGAGHSERILGSVLGGSGTDVLIATKFGITFDEKARTLTGTDTSSDYIHRACERSLARLQRDSIDLYQLHVGDLDESSAEIVADTLEELCCEGLIGAYGWSTDDPEHARLWVGRPHYVAVQHNCNVLEDAPEMLELCAVNALISINRGPLAMGLLAGRIDEQTRFGESDVRGSGATWLPYFSDGQPRQAWLNRVAAVREVLCGGGRTLAQGAIAWLWARSSHTLPIPGFRTVAQVEENTAALACAPLTEAELEEIDRIRNYAAGS